MTYPDEYKDTTERYPNLKYDTCKHCGEETHFYWNCPVEQARVDAETKRSVLAKLSAATDAKNRTVKFIYQWLVSHHGEHTTRQIADKANVSANTARKWLNRLKIAGLVQVRMKFYDAGIYLLLWCESRGKNER